MLLIISHPGKEEEGGNTTTASNSLLMSGASRQRKRILVEEVDKKEDEEELTMPHCSRRGPQAVSRLPVGNAPTSDLQGTFHVGTPVGSKAKPTANLTGHSVVVVEPYCQPCLLNNHGSLVTQAELDELRNCFRILHVISMKALEMGEVLQQARRELSEIVFPTVVLESE